MNNGQNEAGGHARGAAGLKLCEQSLVVAPRLPLYCSNDGAPTPLSTRECTWPRSSMYICCLPPSLKPDLCPVPCHTALAFLLYDHRPNRRPIIIYYPPTTPAYWLNPSPWLGAIVLVVCPRLSATVRRSGPAVTAAHCFLRAWRPLPPTAALDSSSHRHRPGLVGARSRYCRCSAGNGRP